MVDYNTKYCVGHDISPQLSVEWGDM